MDGRSDHPTHVVVRRTITRQLATWNAEHDRFHAEQMWPIDGGTPYLMMTFHDEGEGRVGWYSKYMLLPAFIAWLGQGGGTRVGFGLGVINDILLDMQREIGVLHGARAATG